MTIHAIEFSLFFAALIRSNNCEWKQQPNILWITSEDNGPQLGCYGDDYANTPNIDATC